MRNRIWIVILLVVLVMAGMSEELYAAGFFDFSAEEYLQVFAPFLVLNALTTLGSLYIFQGCGGT